MRLEAAGLQDSLLQVVDFGVEDRARAAGGGSPALAYLAGLAPSGRRGMATALRQAAAALTGGRLGLEGVPWEALQADHVTALKRALTDGGAAPATVNRMISALRGTARAAWRRGSISAEALARIRDVPLVASRRLPAGRHVESGEIRALFSACDLRTAGGARDAALLALAYGSGLRRSELAGLDVEDWDRAGGVLRVTGKGGHQREVYPSGGAATALSVWLRFRGDGPGALLQPVSRFGVVDPRRMSAQAVMLRMRSVGVRAGVAPFTPHDLRRTAVSDLLDAGEDIESVRALVGHASVDTTARYDRRGARAVRAAAAKLHVPVVDPGGSAD